jgi:predicted dehydrogenase
METFNWGIIGPGRIAAQFATDLRRLPDARVAAVASRDGARAADFAARFDVAHVYDSYEALVSDPEVDAVYVSVPHSHHLAATLLALRHGKAVLCEKPLAVNAAQVAEMARVSAEEGVFCMEALWTRFVPVTCQALAWIAEGRIGEVRQLAGAWGFRTRFDPANRLFDLNLAGGSDRKSVV